MSKMINLGGSVDCGTIVSEKFWHHFWQKPFSAESISDTAKSFSQSGGSMSDSLKVFRRNQKLKRCEGGSGKAAGSSVG